MAKSTGMSVDDVFQLVQLQYEGLNRAFEATDDPEEMAKLVDEMNEFTHRLDLLQRQRMEELSANLSALTNDLKAANTKLTKSLKDLSDLNKFLASASEFLGVVDEVIDLLKLV